MNLEGGPDNLGQKAMGRFIHDQRHYLSSALVNPINVLRGMYIA